MESNDAKTMYFVKNSGSFSMGVSKAENEIVISSDATIWNNDNLGKNFKHTALADNSLLEVGHDCKYTFEKLEKKIKFSRSPKATFDHMIQEDIFAGIDAVDLATDFGGKFITDHQVILGGFDKAQVELCQIQDLVI